MRRVFLSLGFAGLLGGCSAILGLPDVVLDDSIGRDGASDVVQPDQTSMDAPIDNFTGDTGIDSGADVVKIPIPLTTGNRPWGLAIDDMYVFWSEPFNFVIGRVNKDGSGVVSLATGSMYAFGVRSVAADGTDVYWPRLDVIYRCARAGCNNAPTPIVQNLTNSAFTIALDSTTVYYSEDTNYGIYKTPKIGGNEMLVANVADRVNELVVVGTTIYATLDNGSLISVPTTGGSPKTIVPPGASSLLGLFIHPNGFAYYTVFNDPGQVAFTGLDGGSMPLALTQRFPFGITGDMNDVYWTNTVTLGPNGNVSKCSIAQCVSSTKVADLQDTPKWIRNDQSAIYWTNAGNSNNSGGVMKLIK